MRRLLERTEGRRKGYQPYKATIGNRVDAATRDALEELRRPVRKPHTKKPHTKPPRKAA